MIFSQYNEVGESRGQGGDTNHRSEHEADHRDASRAGNETV